MITTWWIRSAISSCSDLNAATTSQAVIANNQPDRCSLIGLKQLPGHTEDEFTWLGSKCVVNSNPLGCLVPFESLRPDAKKMCACLEQDPQYHYVQG